MVIIEAAQRLVAQMILVHPIGVSDGRRNCKQYTRDVSKNPQHFHSLGEKEGFHLGWYSGDEEWPSIYMMNNTGVIGYLGLQDSAYDELNNHVPWMIRSVFIDPDYRGQKLGTILYLGALHQFKHMASDGTIGMDAVRVWRSLEKFGYKVQLWSVWHDRTVKFTWGSDGIPEVDGKSIEKTKEEFVFYI